MHRSDTSVSSGSSPLGWTKFNRGYMENIKSVLSFALIFALAASTPIIMVGIMQCMDTRETQYAQSILVDTTSVSDTTNVDTISVSDTTNVDMPDINGRYKRAMLNPNSTDPIKGLTFSVWDD